MIVRNLKLLRNVQIIVRNFNKTLQKKAKILMTKSIFPSYSMTYFLSLMKGKLVIIVIDKKTGLNVLVYWKDQI